MQPEAGRQISQVTNCLEQRCLAGPTTYLCMLIAIALLPCCLQAADLLLLPFVLAVPSFNRRWCCGDYYQ